MISPAAPNGSATQDSQTTRQSSPRGQRGPRTLVGKRRSSRNSLRHGLCAKDVTLAGLESEREWQRLRKAWSEDLSPVGPVERALVERVALCYWRLLRAARYEVSEFAEQQRAAQERHKRQVRAAEHSRAAAASAERIHRALEQLLSPEAKDPELPVPTDEAVDALWAVAEYIGLDYDQVLIFPWPSLPPRTPLYEFDAWTAGLVRSGIAALSAYAHWDEGRASDPARLPVPRLADVAPSAEPADWPDATALTALQAVRRDDTNADERVAIDPAMLLVWATLKAKHNAIRARVGTTVECANHSPEADSAHGLPSDEVLKRVADYEARTERSLFKTLHELQRIQALRQNRPVAAPIALDMCFDGGNGR